MRALAVRIALWLWRTDESFRQYPYGPPSYGIRYGLAWALYHWGIRWRQQTRAWDDEP